MIPIISITTDFGIQDAYVASMKGVILSICPQARMVDITHMIPPQDVRAGAFVLATVYRDFPRGTIHLAVVDPGVGTQRRALAVEAGGYFFVGPDNGLFSWILTVEPEWKAHSLEITEYWRPYPVTTDSEQCTEGSGFISSTFHGRDIFAPVAAHLARGVRLDALGPSCMPIIAQWSAPVPRGEKLHGEVIFVDRFGNAITNLSRRDLEAFAPQGEWQFMVQVSSGKKVSRVEIMETYGRVARGTGLALVGSSGYLEVAINQGNAAKAFGIGPGSAVSVQRRRPANPRQ